MRVAKNFRPCGTQCNTPGVDTPAVPFYQAFLIYIYNKDKVGNSELPIAPSPCCLQKETEFEPRPTKLCHANKGEVSTETLYPTWGLSKIFVPAGPCVTRPASTRRSCLFTKLFLYIYIIRTKWATRNYPLHHHHAVFKKRQSSSPAPRRFAMPTKLASKLACQQS